MMKRDTSSLFRKQQFYPVWILGCGLSTAIGFSAGRAISLAIGYAVDISKVWALSFVFGFAIAGALVGLTQWLVLKTKIPQSSWWILASSLGGAVGSTVAVVVSNAVYGAVNLALFGTLNLAVVWAVSGAVGGAMGGVAGGALVGFVQWLVLKGTIPRSGRWILVSSLGWAAGNAVAAAIDLPTLGAVSSGLTWTLSGAVYGAITGRIFIERSR
jgi:hypothetical protein